MTNGEMAVNKWWGELVSQFYRSDYVVKGKRLDKCTRKQLVALCVMFETAIGETNALKTELSRALAASEALEVLEVYK